jgi:hypothetical protein
MAITAIQAITCGMNTRVDTALITALGTAIDTTLIRPRILYDKLYKGVLYYATYYGCINLYISTFYNGLIIYIGRIILLI